MQTTSRALGKGLASLIPAAGAQTAPAPSEGYFQCPIEDILPSPEQPRKLFSKESLEELSASIREQGVIQPLIVRRIEGGKYELIAGERRLRASKIAGLATVPVVCTQVVPEKVFELALIENIQREDLNPIEEALAYRELQEKYDLTQEEIAQRVGKNRSSVANSLRLLGLNEEIRGDIIEGRLSMGHARALLAIADAQNQLKIKNRVINENMSVRELENYIKDLKEPGRVKNNTKRVMFAVEELDPQLKFLEKEMTARLGTKVKLKPKGAASEHRGELRIEYYSAEDLDRIYQTIVS